MHFKLKITHNNIDPFGFRSVLDHHPDKLLCIAYSNGNAYDPAGIEYGHTCSFWQIIELFRPLFCRRSVPNNTNTTTKQTEENIEES